METKINITTPRSVKLKQETLVIVFILSFAFDFKGAVGGSPLQFCMAGINALTFVLITTIHKYRLPVRGGIAYTFWGWMLFLAVGSLGALLNEVSWEQYIRTIYPFILFIEGILVAWWVTTSSKSFEKKFIKYMTLAAIISFFVTFWWGFSFSGQGSNTIRYQILSPLIPFLISVVIYDFIFTRQHKTKSLITLVGIFIVISLSVTRGPLLNVLITGIIILTGCFWNTMKGYMVVPKPLLRGLFWGFAIVLTGIFFSTLFYPEILSRWISRSFGGHHSITLWTRIAAVAGQWDQIIENPSSWFVGRGFGQPYMWAQRFASLMYPDISTKVLLTPKWYPGEFMWITPIFYSGVFAGVTAISILLYGALSAFKTLVVLLRGHTWLVDDFRPIWISVIAFYSFLASSFTANPFIVRPKALFMGLCLGLLMVLREKMIAKQKLSLQ